MKNRIEVFCAILAGTILFIGYGIGRFMASDHSHVPRECVPRTPTECVAWVTAYQAARANGDGYEKAVHSADLTFDLFISYTEAALPDLEDR